MIDPLSGLTAFVATADLGSFVAAGRVLGLSPSAVGKAVTRLEQKVGVRLFQRSTRAIRLTEEGVVFHERCRRILDDLDDAQAALAHTRESPRGRLRISAPIVSHHLLLPILLEFAMTYPDIELDLDFNDRIVDLIGEGVDVAIRSGSLPDSRLMARALRPFQQLVCASPAYLEKHGTPQTPRELDGHRSVRFRFPNSGKLLPWPLQQPVGEPEPRMQQVIVCNNMEAVHGAVTRGIGIGIMPDFLARESLKNGTICSLLDGFIEGPGQFHLLWPSSRHLSPKIRVFVRFASDKLFGTALTLPANAPA